MRSRTIALAVLALLVIAACKKNGSTDPEVDERAARSTSSASM